MSRTIRNSRTDDRRARVSRRARRYQETVAELHARVTAAVAVQTAPVSRKQAA